MQIKEHLKNKAARALSESMTVRFMLQLARELFPEYDLHKRTGFPTSISIPSGNAAKQIVEDICRAQAFPQFVELLMMTQNQGIKGRKIPIAYLSSIIHGIQNHGYIFDNENRMFMEDSRRRKTLNWGVLREGTEYKVTLLRFDIAGNTKLVRDHPQGIVRKTYQDLFDIISYAIEKRNGRVWNWEGDGGIIAFCFSKRDLAATLSTLESLYNLFLYNKGECLLKKPLRVRFAVHSGLCNFTNNMEIIKKNKTVKDILIMEAKYTKANSITISNKVYQNLDSRIASLFTPLKRVTRQNLFNYELIIG